MGSLLSLLRGTLLFLISLFISSCYAAPYLADGKYTNVIHIRNTVDLHGISWDIPEETVLLFHEGSCIINGKLILKNTELLGNPRILCSVKGSIKNHDIYVDWFTDQSLSALHEYNFFSLLKGHKLIFSNKVYITRVRRMSPSYPIKVDDLEIEGNGATIMVSDTANVIGTIFCFYGCHNLKISNLVLDGRVPINAKTPPDGRHNLNISHCENVRINSVRSVNAMGDGFYINGGENILIDGCVAEDNGRQGCSIISGKRVVIRNSSFNHSCRNAPMTGIDIEPNYSYSTELSVVIDSCQFVNNVSAGIGINVGNRAPKGKVGKSKYITISNCTFSGNGYQIQCAGRENSGNGQILVSNCKMENARYSSVDINAYSAINTPHLIINNLLIHNSNLSNGKDYREHRSVIAVHNVSSISVQGPIGNLEFDNIEIIQDKKYKDNIDRGVLFYPNDKGGYKNVSLGKIKVDLGKPETKYVRKIVTGAIAPEEFKYLKNKK